MRHLCFAIALMASVPGAALAQQDVPVASDTRIKTLVFNENEVYPLTTNYGYQLTVEFGPKEEIATISVGDPVAWQIVPAGQRLFLKAREDNAHTNLSIITTKRTYQFDLFSRNTDTVDPSELVYLVRFYYPDEEQSQYDNGMMQAAPASWASAAPVPPVMSQPAPIPAANTNYAAIATPPAANYNYTLAGPDSIAPTQVFDDGVSTYFQFNSTIPDIALVTYDGKEIATQYRQENGYVVVPAVNWQFTLRSGNDVVCVFNETKRPG